VVPTLYGLRVATVELLSEKSDGYGQVDVLIDGQFQTTVDANAAGIHNQGGQVLFAEPNLSAGQHTLKLVKHGGAYMLLDGLLVERHQSVSRPPGGAFCIRVAPACLSSTTSPLTPRSQMRRPR
jgi:hypothetical protein